MQVNPLDVCILFITRRIEGETEGFHKPNQSGDWFLIYDMLCFAINSLASLVSFNMANKTFSFA
jgi:hypothetical protein